MWILSSLWGVFLNTFQSREAAGGVEKTIFGTVGKDQSREASVFVDFFGIMFCELLSGLWASRRAVHYTAWLRAALCVSRVPPPRGSPHRQVRQH